MVDEEDDTVRFIHHSARSFCLNSPRNAAEWTFTEREANIAIAETLVTYLSYNVFDTRLSKNVVPKIDANSIPAKVALSTMANHQVGSRVTNRLFRLKSQVKQNIGPTLAELGPGYQENDMQEFFLLSYAKSNWIRHTSQLESLPSLPHWYYLLDHAAFGLKRNDIDQAVRQLAVYTESNIGLSPFNTSLYTYPRMIWAMFHGHILLLRHEIIKYHGARKLQAFARLWLLVTKLPEQALLHLDYHLVRWLCLMFIRLGRNQPTKMLLLRRLSASDGCFVEYAGEAGLSCDAEALTVFLSRLKAEDLQHIKNKTRITEWAISSGNAGILYLLVEKGLARDPIVNGRGIAQVLKLDFPDEVKVRLAYCLFRTDFDLDVLGEDGLYRVIQLFRDYAALGTISQIIRKIFASGSRIYSRKQDILFRMACIWEHCDMEETLLRLSASPNESTMGNGCLDIALYGPSTDQVKLIWTLVNFGVEANTEVVDRALGLRYWNVALHFLTRIKHDGLHSYFYSTTCGDSAATIDSFLANAELGEASHSPMPQQCQLPIVQASGLEKWQFYFAPPFVGDDYQGPIGVMQTRDLTNEIHSQFITTQAPSYPRFDNHSQNTRSDTALAVGVDVFVLYLQSPELDQAPCLRLTTPSTFQVVSELTRRCQSTSDSIALLDTDENFVMMTHYENYYPIWDSISRNDGLGRWLLPDSFWDTPKIRQLVEHRRYLTRRNVEDAHWGLQILSKCLSLFLNLPPGTTLDAFDEVGVFPVSKPHGWPRFSRRLLSDLTYMALRIQWLRSLGAMFNKGLLTKTSITPDLLIEMGSMVEVLPGMIELYKGVKHRIHHHGIMPEILEAAFLGAEGKQVLANLVSRSDHWTIEVFSWIRTVDTDIFMWSMGENAPLSFTRAFQSFREVGATDEDMDLLERSLDHARGKVPQLE
jgi:hypothetical protein